MNSTQTFVNKSSAVFVYGWLVLLTLIELFLVLSGFPKGISSLVIAGTTVGKVLLIVLHSMQMKHDRALIWLLPGIPLLLALFFVAMLFPDIVFHQVLLFH